MEGIEGAPVFLGFLRSWAWVLRDGFEGLESGGEFSWKARKHRGEVERVEGIEPSTKAWEAFVLPLNYTRITLFLYAPSARAE